MVPTNLSIGSNITMGSVESPFNLTVTGEGNVTLYEQLYDCWNASALARPGYAITYGLFSKSSGIALYTYEQSSTTSDFEEAVLIQARVGEFVVVSEFSSLPIMLPFMIASLLAIVVYRRRCAHFKKGFWVRL
jgi:hypothetical protein